LQTTETKLAEITTVTKSLGWELNLDANLNEWLSVWPPFRVLEKATAHPACAARQWAI